MKSLIHRTPLFQLVLYVVLAVSFASAQVNIDAVPSGLARKHNQATGYGGVNYNLSTREVTLSQYLAFIDYAGATDAYKLWHSPRASSLNELGTAQDGGSGSYTDVPLKLYSAIGQSLLEAGVQSVAPTGRLARGTVRLLR